ncbi:MAG TPA: gluconate 2-dehydrogenase subunit 3 family protein [Solirubrobacteraceae bacterium]|nr:gluconate 2-dehydrogenase subunit 3 family protein [Solirubrobacteraceae bacterium]
MSRRDVRRPDHLPNLRPGRQPPEPDWLPRQRRGVTPQMIGRYPDYDVFAAEASWDEETRSVVKQRLSAHGPLRFFTHEEEPALRAFCDVTTAQDAEPRIPLAEMVDAKFADGKLDGYRYDDMPEDGETWRRVLRGLDEQARTAGADGFAALPVVEQEQMIEAFAHGELSGGAFEELNVTRAWSVCMRAILSEFYSHPWAWNEIGFGGPAYPRGYMRLGQGVEVLEPFERPGATDRDPARETGDAA